MRSSHLRICLLIGMMLASPVVYAEDVLSRVKAKGVVRCAVDHTPGFSGFDNRGRPHGFDIDFCRAIAAAVFGDANAIRPERINTANKFKALAAGEIDVVLGMATWTYSRDTGIGASFVAPTFFDGQGFLAWSDSHHAQPGNLKGAKICVQKGTTSAENLRDHDKHFNLELNIIVANSTDDRISRFIRHECDLMTGDRTELAAIRIASTLDAKRWVLWPDTISREPIGPYVVANDGRWGAIVRWVVNATQIAELRGITSKSVYEINTQADSELRRLAGLERNFGKPLGLRDDWARQVITQVGNYGEIFDRHLGMNSPFHLERGANNLGSKGGLFFPPPLR